MATVTAISTKGGGGGKATLKYICRDDKTENGKYITTLNCSLPTVYQEFKNTREMYGKTEGIKYYHFVQSHPSGYEIEPALAHRIAVEFAEKAFSGFECIVATHTDAEHIHSHIVFNSVNADTGMKYHSNKFTLNDLRNLSDEICQRYCVQILQKPENNHQTNGITTAEYRSAMKGESWKIDLINTIDEIMKQAKTKKQFCFLMRQRGYSVRREDSRKYITYTCPNGKRCRDNRLHEVKYSKEMMQSEFKIRADEIGFESELKRSYEHTASDLRSGGKLESCDKSADLTHPSDRTGQSRYESDNDFGTDGDVYEESASHIRPGEIGVQTYSADYSRADECFADKLNQTVGEAVLTGWEAERGILLEAERLRRMETQNAIENAQGGCDIADGDALIIGGIADLAAIIDESEEDEDIDRHSDSKLLTEEARLKEALGMHLG